METYTILFSGVSFITANSSEQAYNQIEAQLSEISDSWEIQVSE
jgi:hypothetical protein